MKVVQAESALLAIAKSDEELFATGPTADLSGGKHLDEFRAQVESVARKNLPGASGGSDKNSSFK